MKIVEVDGTAVNGSGELRVGINNETARPLRARIDLQNRSRQSPTIRSIQKDARVFELKISPSDPQFSSDAYLEAFERQVGRLFEPGRKLMPIVAERIPGNALTEMLNYGVVQDLDPPKVNRYPFVAKLLMPDEKWTNLLTTVETTSPITVGGNAQARPTVVLTSTGTGTRNRATITDRTSQGAGGWMNAIDWTHPAAETWLWVNGVPMPFLVSGGKLWFRTDINALQSTSVDIYHIAGSTNTRFADRLERSGTVLNAALAARTSVEADIATAGRNPVSSMLTWHPMPTAAHWDSLPYTYGLSAENQITLIDREAAGERQLLADDADSFVLSSPVEISGISAFDITVASGIRLPDSDTSEADDFSRSITEQPDRPAYLKVRVGVGGFSLGTFEYVHTEDAEEDIGVEHSVSNVVGGWEETWNEKEDGEMTSDRVIDNSRFQGSFTYGGSEGSIYNRDLTIYEDFDSDLGDLESHYQLATWISQGKMASAIAAAADGASVALLEQSGGWTYLVTFPAGSYAGVALPFLSFSNSGDLAILVDQAWVDSSGDVITSDEASGTSDPKNGRIKVVLRYRVRDDETWYTAWSQIVDGTLAAEPQTLTVPAQSFPTGATQIALGLESVANGKTAIDWGVLTVEENPVLTFMAGKTPLPDVSEDISAMMIEGTLLVDADGDGVTDYTLQCDKTFVDTGLIVDCLTPWIDTSTQPVYNRPLLKNSDLWIALEPVEGVSWSTTGNIDTVEFQFQERYTI